LSPAKNRKKRWTTQIVTENTPIKDVIIINPEVFKDERGFFTKVYRKDQV
jgi:dTDP-4-dehydrorhamnose 3,5-epimerase-like enzyme